MISTRLASRGTRRQQIFQKICTEAIDGFVSISSKKSVCASWDHRVARVPNVAENHLQHAFIQVNEKGFVAWSRLNSRDSLSGGFVVHAVDGTCITRLRTDYSDPTELSDYQLA